MPLKLSPEYWVMGFVKSATNGKNISIRLRRILTIILTPIWLGGLVWAGYMTYIGVTAYQKVKKIEHSIRETNKHYSQYNPNTGSFTTDPYYLRKLESRLSIENDNKDLVYCLPAFLVIGFLVPWVLLRLIFWIVDADNTKE
jgi:hypothetical protein